MSKINVEEISRSIFEKLDRKIERSGLKKEEIGPDFDFVKTGLLDSLSFVDLVMELEHQYNIEIDFEDAFKQASFTTFEGLTKIIAQQTNG